MEQERPLVVIPDYGIGNVASVANMLGRIGALAVRSRDPEVVVAAERIILPGVGAFDPAAEALERSGLGAAVSRAADDGAFVLGICLGAQLLMDGSEEGVRPGLALIPGSARLFQMSDRGLRVPHMGWNLVVPEAGAVLFPLGPETQRFYFAHSYYMEASQSEHVAARCTYGHTFACLIQKGRVFGAQFHPEKSHRFGMGFLRRFLEIPC